MRELRLYDRKGNKFFVPFDAEKFIEAFTRLSGQGQGAANSAIEAAICAACDGVDEDGRPLPSGIMEIGLRNTTTALTI